MRRLFIFALATMLLPLGTGSAVTRGTPSASAASRPNIVLILTDDQTMESVAKMPHVGTRTDWIRFRRAFVQNAMCCPSRATILTGRYDTHTRVQNNGQTGNFDASNTVAVWLKRNGYRTALIGKYLNNYPSAFASSGYPVPPGWTTFQAVVDPNPGTYGQYEWDLAADGVAHHYGSAPADYQLDVLAGRARGFIANSGSTPFFLYFAPTATHGPWIASPRRTGMFDGAPVPRVAGLFNEPDVSDKPAYIKTHAVQDPALMDERRRKHWAAVVSLDDAVKSLDAQLVSSGDYDDTVVILMTDNGYAFGEHRWHGKACEYAVCNQTPLLVRWPGHAAKDVWRLVSNVDIASTVAGLAGVTPAAPQDGRSLVPLLTGTVSTWRTGLLLHWPGHIARKPGDPDYVPPFWGIRTADHLYVEIGTGERELYDLKNDPNELANLAGRPAYATVQEQLRRRLAELKATAN